MKLTTMTTIGTIRLIVIKMTTTIIIITLRMMTTIGAIRMITRMMTRKK